VLKLSPTPILTAVTREQIFIDGIEPDGTGPYAILLEPIEDDAYGLAQIAGVCPAWVDVTAITDTHGSVSSGEYTLTGGSDGLFELLQLPADTGEQLCVVRINHAASVDRRLWRVQFGETTNTGSGNPTTIDYTTYADAATWKTNQYMTQDTGAKTITFATAGDYTVNLYALVYGGTLTSDVLWTFTAGVWRGVTPTWYAQENSGFPLYIPWFTAHHVAPVRYGVASMQSYLPNVAVGDLLGAKIKRLGTDQSTTCTAYLIITIGPAW